MKRRQARRHDGQFIRNTMENTFGLSVMVHEHKTDGTWCGALNAHGINETAATVCRLCGELLTGAKP